MIVHLGVFLVIVAFVIYTFVYSPWAKRIFDEIFGDDVFYESYEGEECYKRNEI